MAKRKKNQKQPVDTIFPLPEYGMPFEFGKVYFCPNTPPELPDLVVAISATGFLQDDSGWTAFFFDEASAREAFELFQVFHPEVKPLCPQGIC